jgi:hypothetical protein
MLHNADTEQKEKDEAIHEVIDAFQATKLQDLCMTAGSLT